MSTGKPFRFPPGKDLAEELSIAMKRIESYGIVYPNCYYPMLLEKYTRETILHPNILMIIGKSRINNHFFYSTLLQKMGRLLDYGCGTGDNVRQLIRSCKCMVYT